MDFASQSHLGLRPEEPCSFPVEEDNKQHIARNNQNDFRQSVQSQLVRQFFTIQRVVWTREPPQNVKGGELQHANNEEEPDNFSGTRIGPRNGKSAANQGAAN